jgi:ribosomal-protein-alanine acetyltransferase
LSLLVRRFKTEDLDIIANLERDIFNQTYALDFLDTFRSSGEILVAVLEQNIVGLIGWFSNQDAAEIIMIGVIETARCQKIATRLLIAAISLLKQNQVQTLFIEVRESNEAATAFYQKNGFKVNRIRKNYYQNPQEDAIEMSVNL